MIKRTVMLVLAVIIAFSVCVNAEESVDMGTTTIETNAEILGANLVLNGSFENGTEEWENWEGKFAVANETFYTGNKSIKIWANTTGANEQLLQNVKVVPGATYNFSAWIRVPSGQSVKASLLLSGAGYAQETLMVKSVSYDETKADPSFCPNKVNGDAGDGHTLWQNIGGTVTIPAAEAFSEYVEGDVSTYPNICIYFQYTTGGNWNRYAYIDNVSLERVYEKNEPINSVKFYQNGVDVSETGFDAGTVIAVINTDDITINGKRPYVIAVVYSGEELLAFACNTATSINTDGTINLVAPIEITEEMGVMGCTISAFVWSDLNSMMSISEVYSISQQ